MKIASILKLVAAAVVAGVSGMSTGGELTSASYSQEGLIAQWDGIENVGRGLEHVVETNVWKDLVGTRDLTLNGVKALFTENALSRGESGGHMAQNPTACTSYQTVEIVCERAASGAQVAFDAGNGSHMLLFNRGTIQGGSGNKYMFQSTETRTTYAFTYNGTSLSGVYEGGHRLTRTNGSESWGSGGRLTVGAYSRFTYNGKIYAIRLYDRVLTDTELYAHTAIDGVRFFGWDPPVSGLTVRTRGAGEVRVDGGSWVPSCSQERQVGEVISLEARAASGSAFVAWEDSEGRVVGTNVIQSSCSITFAARGRVLTAVFEETASQPETKVTDYVYDGLVAMWDGLLNTGYGCPHDAATNVWKDLAGARDIPLVQDYSKFVDASALECLTRASGPAAGPVRGLADVKTLEIVCTLKDNATEFIFMTGAGPFLMMESSKLLGQRSGNLYMHSRNLATYAVTYPDSAIQYYEDATELTLTSGSDSWTIPDTLVTIGAPPPGNNQSQNLYKGKIYAIRLYDRVLTPDELYHNMQVDGARYFGRPITRNEITVKVRGQGTVDADGRGYAAEQAVPTGPGERHVFKAKADDGWEFVAWEASDGSLSSTNVVSPEISIEATSYFTLTAVFAETATRPADIAADYAYDGLVAMWDGIENVGHVRAHDSSATVWKDLVGNRDLTLVSGSGAFTENALQCLSRTSGGPVEARSADFDVKTVEIVAVRPGRVQQYLLGTGSGPQVTSSGLYAGLTGVPGGGPVFAYSESCATYAFVKDGSYGGRAFENGSEIVRLAGFESMGSGTGLTVGYLSTSPWRDLYVGTIYAIRLYDRVLSDAEIGRNANLDLRRFFGKTPADSWTRCRLNARGETEYLIRALTDGNGEVSVNGGAFSTSNDVWVVAGSPVTVEARPRRSYVFTCWGEFRRTVVDESSVNAKTLSFAANGWMELTAKFTALRPVQDASAASYVRDGLIAQWDGVENAGLGRAHDAAATVWKDLAGTNDLTLCAGRADFTNNALRCTGSRATEVTNGLEGVVTVEVVLDRQEADDWGVPFYNVDSAGGSFAVVSLRRDFSLRPQSGRMQGYYGEHVSLSCADGIFHVNGNKAPVTDASQAWSKEGSGLLVGSMKTSTSTSYRGRIYSIRVYNRALTDEERIHNYEVDAIRFLGVKQPRLPGLMIQVK